MRIRKAVITAAGPAQRALPLQTLVDRDGRPKAALEILLAEAVEAGAEEIAVVVRPGDEDPYRRVAGAHADRLRFLAQEEPRGYGHALYCARGFTGDEPFLHLVSDHLWVSTSGTGCARQIVALAEAEACSVSGVQPTPESMLGYYGAVGGEPVAGRTHLVKVDRVREKPTPTQAEQDLIVPGLRAGHYLCFFGLHVFTAGVMARLQELGAEGDTPPSLSAALGALAGREKYLALTVEGHRYNLGLTYGLFYAQLALALRGRDRDEVLTHLVDLLAQRERDREA